MNASIASRSSRTPPRVPTTVHRWTVAALLASGAAFELAAATVPDNGFGTAALPINLPYQGESSMFIVDGLPPGVPIEFHNPAWGLPVGATELPGGSLGGHEQTFQTELVSLQLTSTFPGWVPRSVSLPLNVMVTHSEPRTLLAPVQSFDTVLFRLQGQILGDPDFDLLRITAGTDFGLPSPGHTTLTQAGPNWAVDSFFDVTYRIDFVGAPGGHLAGMSGSTVGTVRMSIQNGGEIPEPATWGALGVLCGGLAWREWRRGAAQFRA